MNNIMKLSSIGLVDKIVIFYFYSWVNYLQTQTLNILSKKYLVNSIIPFDSINVIKKIFKTSDVFRKKNNWNKQLIRDVFEPYVEDKLYKNKARSLVVHYNDWFKENYQDIISYLETSEVLKNLIDWEIYKKNYNKLPEPGLNLIRLLSISLWYDVNWNRKNLINFEKMFSKLI